MSQHIRNIKSTREFNELVSQTKTPVIVDFWAPWCGPCQALGPILDEAGNQLGTDTVIAKVNVDELPDVAREHGITSIPTLFYFAGGQLQKRESGIAQVSAIIANVNSLSATA